MFVLETTILSWDVYHRSMSIPLKLCTVCTGPHPHICVPCESKEVIQSRKPLKPGPLLKGISWITLQGTQKDCRSKTRLNVNASHWSPVKRKWRLE